ncbi:uncharacterized protein BJ171DRAFT_598101 [Polychytrium aggregatum]|uniref:uncharacterized protein n=1 Tax=Polychytrium aggregatum TaxID=110093 RepID=UPI0022FDBC12|nr:uncharacterized protein BJ171DRAFT_598101 [Polychytrium aggregatum]KAI9205914.1 hypothetical protein BJ171DRAFT_598101 [Polychytrium aggregatum]
MRSSAQMPSPHAPAAQRRPSARSARNQTVIVPTMLRGAPRLQQPQSRRKHIALDVSVAQAIFELPANSLATVLATIERSPREYAADCKVVGSDGSSVWIHSALARSYDFVGPDGPLPECDFSLQPPYRIVSSHDRPKLVRLQRALYSGLPPPAVDSLKALLQSADQDDPCASAREDQFDLLLSRLASEHPAKSLAHLQASGVGCDFQIILEPPSMPSDPKTTGASAVSSTPELCDTTVAVHRFLLIARIPYMRALLTSGFREQNSATARLPSDVFGWQAVRFVVDHVYGSATAYPPEQLADIFAIYAATEYLGLAGLMDVCSAWLSMMTGGFACTCSPCLALVPKMARFATDRGLEPVLQGCRLMAVKNWARLYTQKLVAELPDDFGMDLETAVAARINVETLSEYILDCKRAADTLDCSGSAGWVSIAQRMVERVRTQIIKTIQAHPGESIRMGYIRFLNDPGISARDTRIELLRTVKTLVRDSSAKECLLALSVVPAADDPDTVDDQARDELALVAEIKGTCTGILARQWMVLSEPSLLQGLNEQILDDVARAVGVSSDELFSMLARPTSGFVRSSAATRTKLHPLIKLELTDGPNQQSPRGHLPSSSKTPKTPRNEQQRGLPQSRTKTTLAPPTSAKPAARSLSKQVRSNPPRPAAPVSARSRPGSYPLSSTSASPAARADRTVPRRGSSAAAPSITSTASAASATTLSATTESMTASHPVSEWSVLQRVQLSLSKEQAASVTGTIRFVGATEFATGQWVGLELDSSARLPCCSRQTARTTEVLAGRDTFPPSPAMGCLCGHPRYPSLNLLSPTLMSLPMQFERC